ncbi:AP-like endonuclease/reverse transcriptase [Aphelenchoides avenae]|nr:AP-like endonuclease/reverse transcriptase [Aphelenchus avenae]
MIAMGMPTCIVQCVHAFLSDRRARVQIDHANSRSFPLKAGTPQGSVLSPILFLIFVNNILDDMPAGVETSLYADDLALWAQGVDLADIKARRQTALDRLSTWAECWKMQINVEKTVTTFFTTEASQSRWRPELSVNGQQLPYDGAPTFLGVTLDRALRFTAHAEKVRSKMTKRLNFLSALRGTKWGCSRQIAQPLQRLRAISSRLWRCGVDASGKQDGTGPGGRSKPQCGQNRYVMPPLIANRATPRRGRSDAH